jgi:hypothetical protein
MTATPAPLYKIANWHALYEPSESRRSSGPMKWIPVVTKTDGLGFGLLRQQKNRTELLAAWYLLLGIAAKQDQGTRGMIARDGVPLTDEDLGLMTGFPVGIFTAAFTFFTQPRQGWLVKGEPQSDGTFLFKFAQKCSDVNISVPTRQDRTGENKTGENRTEQNSSAVFPEKLNTPAFAAAWADFAAYRAERRLAAWKPRTIAHQLEAMAGWGEAAAVESIRNSIRNGWQGVFPPNAAQGARGERGVIDPQFNKF